ncbi:MAG TPA: hypothetical protein VL974_01250 [Magnetospirillum sp.]|jgi:hypothetical protein|nr:hypothetical protein [Magnetospirillum sp.]
MRRFRLAVLAAALLACGSAAADQATAIQAAKAQPRVIDAQVDNSGNMYLFVKPEKIAWSQFAAGMCGVVKPHQGRIFRMRVIEVTQANYSKPPASWPRLAEADCSR